MKSIKAILRTPSALVILLASIVTLVGVIITNVYNERITFIPIEATMTAEARLTVSAQSAMLAAGTVDITPISLTAVLTTPSPHTAVPSLFITSVPPLPPSDTFTPQEETGVTELPPAAVLDAEISNGGSLTAMYNGEKYYIVPAHCWIVGNRTSKAADYETATITFIVPSTQDKILINDISIILDSYTPPPDFKQLTEYKTDQGIYHLNLDFLKYIDLGIVDIFPGNAKFRPENRSSAEVPGMDAIGFRISPSFRKSGKYTFHIEILLSDLKLKTQKITSDTMQFNWIQYPDLEGVIFYDQMDSQGIVAKKCP